LAPNVGIHAATNGVLDAIAKDTILFFFGRGSGGQKMLNEIRKGFKAKDVYNVVYRAKRRGIKPAGSFIVAYLGEGKKDFEETLTLVRDLPLMDHFVSIVEPIPGAPLAGEIADRQVSENLLFVRDISSLEDFRAYRLMMEGYCARSPLSLGDQGIAKLFLQEAYPRGKEVLLPASK